MKPLMIACLIAVATTAASAQTRTALQVIRDEGALLLVEGGSFYRFNRDSSFRSGPIGLSGRVITGRWRGGDDLFIVEGRWGWVNGQSLPDDYRRMTIRIARIDGPGTLQSLPLSGVVNSVRVHSGYYYVDDVVRIPPPASANSAASVSPVGASEIYISTNHMPGVAEVRWRMYDDRCTLEIDYRAAFSASAPPPTQVWLLRNDGTLIAPTRAAVGSGAAFGGNGPPKVAYHYAPGVERDAAAVLVKLGDEYLFKSFRR